MDEEMAKASGADSKKNPPVNPPGKPGKSGKSTSAGKRNLLARLAQYLRDVRSEMKRVVWPQRPEVFNSSMVVVVTLVFFVFFTLATDTVVVWALGLISKLGQS
jgi:preprotein translocase subunit SecE